MRVLGKFICGSYDGEICLWLETWYFTSDSHYEDPDRFQVYMGHSNRGVSTQMMYHLAQNYKNAAFKKYDYGADKNRQVYGQSDAPNIDLQSIARNTRVPIAFFAARHDTFSVL